MSTPEPQHRDRASPSTSRPSRRAADPFGEVLPEHTRDEGPEGWGEREYDDDERLRREVPPHHR